MEKEPVVLCAASAYEEKYYFNPQFKNLPQDILDELQVLCVTFTADVGGIMALQFAEDGQLEIYTEAAEEDLLYDEIGSVLKVKQIQREKEELLTNLELYYKAFFT